MWSCLSAQPERDLLMRRIPVEKLPRSYNSESLFNYLFVNKNDIVIIVVVLLISLSAA